MRRLISPLRHINNFIQLVASSTGVRNGFHRRTFALATATVLGAAALASAGGPKVYVSTAAELQQQVFDAANAGKTIVLAPNTYTLDPAGPTAGRLELQTDMKLEGKPGHPEAVIIDASLLPTSLNQDGMATGALRMGRGHNAVRWMTLQNASALAAFIETDLQPTVPDAATSVTVEHCVIEGNIRGIDFRLAGTAANGRTLTGYFNDNVLQGNTFNMGQGIRIVFLQGVQGATLHATLQGNTSARNLAGLFAAANGSSGNTITIDSKNDSFTDNGVGAVLVAGLSTGKQADDNSLTFDSQNDEFSGNNVLTDQYSAAGAGVSVNGADSAAPAPGKTNRNSATVSLRNARFSGNPAGDLVTFGAHGANGWLAGTYNQVVVMLLGNTRGLDIVLPVDSDPYDPTNHVTIIPPPGH